MTKEKQMHGVPSRLRAFCEWLGDDPDEMAYTLAALDCDGVPGVGWDRQNPVEIAIRRYVGTWPGTKVSKTHVHWNDSQILNFLLPKPVQAFIKAFDDNRYPFLVKEGKSSSF